MKHPEFIREYHLATRFSSYERMINVTLQRMCIVDGTDPDIREYRLWRNIRDFKQVHEILAVAILHHGLSQFDEFFL